MKIAMSTPAMMPRKLPEGLSKVRVDEELEALRAKINKPIDPFAKLDKDRKKNEARKARNAEVHRALNGSPLNDAISREEKHQKRQTKKNQAIARNDRKRRPKKR